MPDVTLRVLALQFVLASAVLGTAAASAPDSAQSPAGVATMVPYAIAPRGYLVTNAMPAKPRTFFVIHDFGTFGSVFSYGMTERPRPKLISAEDFGTHMIFAVVMQGPICNLRVSTITAVGPKYTVAYTMICDTPMPTGIYNNPMIVSVPARETSSVTFVENGETQAVIEQSSTPLPK
jgi:hypothetical protein